jgi:flagellar protein FlaG
LNFSIDEKLGRPVVTVRNESTGEVVRQIPNEVVVRVAHSIDELKGLLLNEKT